MVTVALLVALVISGPAEQWTREDLEQVRALLREEYIGPDRAAALAAVEELLDGLAFGQPAGRDELIDLGVVSFE